MLSRRFSFRCFRPRLQVYVFLQLDAFTVVACSVPFSSWIFLKFRGFLDEFVLLCDRDQCPFYLIGRNFVGRNFRRAKLFVGRNFRHQTKNLSLSPDEKFRPIKVKVSLVEMQIVRWLNVIMFFWVEIYPSLCK